MATQRLTMKNIREILRQKWALDRTHRDVALSLRVSAGVVGKVVGKAGEAGLTWADVEGLSDEDLARVVYDGEPAAAKAWPLPDFPYVHTERRRKGVTLALLHVEYLEKHPSGYRYTQFCDLYRAWLKRRGLTMRIEHVASDKAFVDYSGNKLHLVDPRTGECTPVELFVGVLGASNYTYAEASMTQRGHDFIDSNARMLEYFGGVPAALVPDQLKAAVTKSCWYDPKIQRTYAALEKRSYEVAHVHGLGRTHRGRDDASGRDRRRGAGDEPRRAQRAAAALEHPLRLAVDPRRRLVGDERLPDKLRREELASGRRK